MVVATLFQVVVGVLLLVSVQPRLTPAVTAAVTVGVLAAMLLLGVAFYRNPLSGAGRMTSALVLLPVILVSMLLARQFLQHQAVAPLQSRLELQAQKQKLRLEPLQPAAFQGFVAHLATVYDNGETIFANSCAFCHGQDGDGPEAAGLIVPPEKLNQVRAQRQYVYQMVLKGVPGSGMPYFSVFDRAKLESLLDYLERRFGMTGPIQPFSQPGDMAAAQKVFADTCAKCHGDRGQVSSFGRDLRPPPPDLTRYGLTPSRAFEVVTAGYAGTVMQPFQELPEATRWGLVRLVASLRTNP